MSLNHSLGFLFNFTPGMHMTTETVTAFNQLALKEELLKVLDEVGYESPSPIQAQTIPLLLEGKDVLGQAQTGTGKTAAFALPLLSNLNLSEKDPQVLVLAPTRELAIQVAEAFQTYASKLKGFHVLPVYGGADYSGQIRALKRGVHVVVGTPGRVMDHMRKKTLVLDNLQALVLDEADEMLRMGFIDDVEWVLEQTPPTRQIALFSATMPAQIRRIATKYLNEPHQITIENKTSTASTIRQRFWPVSGLHKLDALTRILEAEEFDAIIIFVRTKTATVELTEKLEARGYATGAINGDIAQNQRERTIQNLKNGKLDILVATDVAARGLDVQRISHVINYDIPYDTEAYVHRIGRTGRAGRKGDAILFVAPREKGLLNSIERATKQKIEMMELPSTQLINDNRVVKFKQRITDTLASEGLEFFANMIEEYQQEHDVPAENIATALAKLLQGDAPFLLQNKPQPKSREKWDRDDRPSRNKRDGGRDRGRGDRDAGRDGSRRRERSSRNESSAPEEGMQRFRLEVGHNQKVKPGNIVGAIANEAGIDSKFIGRININDDYSLVDLPNDIPKDVLNDLKKTRVGGQKLNISAFNEGGNTGDSKSRDSRPRDNKSQDGKPRYKSKDSKSGDRKPKSSKSKDSDSRPKKKDTLRVKDKAKTKVKKSGEDKPRKKLTL